MILELQGWEIVGHSSRKEKRKGNAYEDDIPDVVLVDDEEEEKEDFSDDENYTWDGEDAYEEDDFDIDF